MRTNKCTNAEFSHINKLFRANAELNNECKFVSENFIIYSLICQFLACYYGLFFHWEFHYKFNFRHTNNSRAHARIFAWEKNWGNIISPNSQTSMKSPIDLILQSLFSIRFTCNDKATVPRRTKQNRAVVIEQLIISIGFPKLWMDAICTLKTAKMLLHWIN